MGKMRTALLKLSQAVLANALQPWIFRNILPRFSSSSNHLSFINISQGMCHTMVKSFGFQFVLSLHFLFYFEGLTLLSFQVTCSSSCVTSLIVFSDPRVVPPVPHFPPCVFIVCVSLCPVPVCFATSLVFVRSSQPSIAKPSFDSQPQRSA